MSSISSVGSNQDLMQVLQQANGQGTTPSVANRQNSQAQFDAKAKSAGIDIDGLKGLHSEMQTAVQDALKNADPSANRQDTIQNAINGVLKDHGYDPDKLKSQFEAAGLKAPGQYDASGKVSGQKHGHHHHGKGQSAQATQGATSDTDGSASIAAVLKQANAGTLVDMAA